MKTTAVIPFIHYNFSDKAALYAEAKVIKQ